MEERYDPEEPGYTLSLIEQNETVVRINELEQALGRVKPLKHQANGNRVDLGSVVYLEGLQLPPHITLVHSFEANPSQQLISIDSPLGKALFGRRVGNVVTFVSPRGRRQAKITALE
jgi:transcription elongation GreA/GreB family factor